MSLANQKEHLDHASDKEPGSQLEHAVEVVIDAEANKKLLRRIDKLVMPVVS